MDNLTGPLSGAQHLLIFGCTCLFGRIFTRVWSLNWSCPDFLVKDFFFLTTKYFLSLGKDDVLHVNSWNFCQFHGNHEPESGTSKWMTNDHTPVEHRNDFTLVYSPLLVVWTISTELLNWEYDTLSLFMWGMCPVCSRYCSPWRQGLTLQHLCATLTPAQVPDKGKCTWGHLCLMAQHLHLRGVSSWQISDIEKKHKHRDLTLKF